MIRLIALCAVLGLSSGVGFWLVSSGPTSTAQAAKPSPEVAAQLDADYQLYIKHLDASNAAFEQLERDRDPERQRLQEENKRSLAAVAADDADRKAKVSKADMDAQQERMDKANAENEASGAVYRNQRPLPEVAKP